MKRRLFAGFLLLLTLAAIADTEGALIRSKFKKGQVQRIKTVTDVTIQYPSVPGMGSMEPMTVQTTAVQKRTITNVGKDGSAQVKVETESMKTKAAGKEEEAKKEDLTSMTYTLDTLGRISKMVTKNEKDNDPMQKMFKEVNALSPGWPVNKVKVGDTWTVKEKSPMDPSKDIVYAYKLESIEPLGSDKVYKLKADIELPIDLNMPTSGQTPPMKIKGVGKGVSTTLIRVEDADMVRNDSDITMNMEIEMDSPDLPAELRKMNMTVKVKVQQFQLPTTKIR